MQVRAGMHVCDTVMHKLIAGRAEKPKAACGTLSLTSPVLDFYGETEASSSRSRMEVIYGELTRTLAIQIRFERSLRSACLLR
jgi:hypothetical protein